MIDSAHIINSPKYFIINNIIIYHPSLIFKLTAVINAILPDVPQPLITIPQCFESSRYVFKILAV